MIRLREDPETPLQETAEQLPELEAGDHLDQKTFHARYEAMPEDVRAELIGGVVYMPSPLKERHGRTGMKVGRWLDEYEEATPGVETAENATVILGESTETQPDHHLRILTENADQASDDREDYVVGSPELIVETASSTESHDLHNKKQDYEAAGVREYVVIALRQQKVFWFILREGKFQENLPSTDGILRSEVFPGLWLDPAALLRNDRARLLEVLRQGLASPEHAAFVARLKRE